MRALANRDRRAFVKACLAKARSAGELAEASALAPASVSEHLKVLRKAGLLELDVRGRFWYYRSVPKKVAAAAAALAALVRHR